MAGPVISIGPQGDSSYQLPNYAPLVQGGAAIGQGFANLGQGLGNMFAQQRSQKSYDDALAAAFSGDDKSFYGAIGSLSPQQQTAAIAARQSRQAAEPEPPNWGNMLVNGQQVLVDFNDPAEVERYRKLGGVMMGDAAFPKPDNPTGSYGQFVDALAAGHFTGSYPEWVELNKSPGVNIDLGDRTTPRETSSFYDAANQQEAKDGYSFLWIDPTDKSKGLQRDKQGRAIQTKLPGTTVPGEKEKTSITGLGPARSALSDLYNSILTEDAGWWWDERGQKQNQLYTILKSQVINLEQRGANFTENEEKIIEEALGQSPLSLQRKLFDTLGGGQDAYLRRLQRFAELIEQKAASLEPAMQGQVDTSFVYPWQQEDAGPVPDEAGLIEQAVDLLGMGKGESTTDSGTATTLEDQVSTPTTQPTEEPSIIDQVMNALDLGASTAADTVSDVAEAAAETVTETTESVASQVADALADMTDPVEIEGILADLTPEQTRALADELDRRAEAMGTQGDATNAEERKRRGRGTFTSDASGLVTLEELFA